MIDSCRTVHYAFIVKDRPFTGRLRKSTANEDRYITLISRHNRFIAEKNRSVLCNDKNNC